MPHSARLLLAPLVLAGMALPAVACPDDVQAFEKADANRDGIITLDEIRSLQRTGFARLDRNGDGYAEPSDAPRRFRRRYEARFNPLKDKFDLNGDGRISRAEFTETPLPAFERTDTNGDGQLDAAERTAARAQACATASDSSKS